MEAYYLACFNCGTRKHISDMVPGGVVSLPGHVYNLYTKIVCSETCRVIMVENLTKYNKYDLLKSDIEEAEAFVLLWNNDKTINPSTGLKIYDHYVRIKRKVEEKYTKCLEILHRASQKELCLEASKYLKSLMQVSDEYRVIAGRYRSQVALEKPTI